MEKIKGKLPYLASAASALIFGFSYLFTKNALDTLAISQLLGLRFLVAALALWILKLLKVIKINVRLKEIKPLLLVAIFQPVLYFIFETIGVNLTSASEGGVLISLLPVAVAVLAAFILDERLTQSQWLSVVASVCGVFLISLSGFKQGSSSHLLGALALLTAAISGGLYNVYSKKASTTSSPIEVTYVMMWVGAILFNLAGLIMTPDLTTYFEVLTEPNIVVAILYLGLLSSIVAFFCLNYSLSKLSPSKSAVFINLAPVVSIISGVAFRGESFTLMQLLGSAVILLGVWGVNRVKENPADCKDALQA